MSALHRARGRESVTAIPTILQETDFNQRKRCEATACRWKHTTLLYKSFLLKLETERYALRLSEGFFFVRKFGVRKLPRKPSNWSKQALCVFGYPFSVAPKNVSFRKSAAMAFEAIYNISLFNDKMDHSNKEQE